MNKIFNKVMPEVHLGQPRFNYSAFKQFTKHCERFFREKFRNSEKQMI